MMARLYLILALAALSGYGYAQYRGIGLFDDTGSSGLTRSSTGGRTAFHK